MIELQELSGTVIWVGGVNSAKAVATFGDQQVEYSEKKFGVSNECRIVADGTEIGDSVREASFLKIVETLRFDGRESGLVLRRGMINTKFEWGNASHLLAMAFDSSNDQNLEASDSDFSSRTDEDSDSEEDQAETAERRSLKFGRILLEQTDFSSEIHVSGSTTREALIAGFLAFRIWAKSNEGR